MSKTFTLKEIASRLKGEFQGDGDRVFTGVAPLKDAGSEQISYIESDRYLKDLEVTSAGAVILDPRIKYRDDVCTIRVAQPAVAWAEVVELFYPRKVQFTEVSADALVGDDCEFAEGVGIGPGAIVGNRVRIGKETEIYPGSTVGDDVEIGENCRICSGVHIYYSCVLENRVILHSGAVIGADGYGYAQEKRDNPAEPIRHRKVPQVGRVVIQDDVEISANSAVDRGSLGDTVIGHGTKIDNLVHIAHNCRLGPHTLLVAQVGLAGSIEGGPYVAIGGQAGIAEHVKIGAGARIGAQSGVIKDVPEGQEIVGTPALPGGLAHRAYASIKFLPDLRKKLRDLETRVAELEAGKK